MSLDRRVIDEIKDRLDLVQVMEQSGGADLHKNGAGYVGWHKAHDSQSKSGLKVHGGIWNCFTCGQGGDVLTWLGHQELGNSYADGDAAMFRAALEKAAQLAGVDLPDVDVEAMAERRGLEEIFALAADFYHAQLDDEQRAYLHARGFTDATIDRLKIGYAPPYKIALVKHLRSEGVGDDDIIKTGLVVRRQSGGLVDFFQGRIIFPYWNRGRVVYFIGRQTDETPDVEWEQGKYKKQLCHGDKHPYVSEQVRNEYFYGEDDIRGQDMVVITEGVADCIIANQEGFPCVSPVTVRFAERDHPRIIALTQRSQTVYLCNDNETNAAGREGALATAQALWEAGITVRFVDLPRAEGVEKIDLNDFLVERGAAAFRDLLPAARTLLEMRLDDVVGAGDKQAAWRDVFRLLALSNDEFAHVAWRDELPARLGIGKRDYDRLLASARMEAEQAKRKPQAGDAGHARYAVRKHQICRVGEDSETGETFYKPLCNFDARIIANVLRDDGEEVARHLAIAGTLQNGEPLSEVVIKASEFERMSWVVSEWGGKAAIEPKNHDHVRHAIQTLSIEGMDQRRSYIHTGWRVIDGQRVFLHAGGALGMDGVAVELPTNLGNYELPSSAEDPVHAMRQSIKLLDMARPHISYPVWAAMYLAPLSGIIPAPFVLWIEGASGIYKSSFTTMMLNHFGSAFDEFSTPADWTGTANSLEKLAFVAKDIPLLIDDFKPAHSRHENQAMQTSAQRIIRAVGNRQGRSRLDGDSEFRRTFAPRGVVLSTAERGALGKSTAARLLTVALEEGDIDLDKLSKAQHQRHIYAHAMAGFLRFVAEHWDMLSNDLHGAVLKTRTENADGGGHKRLPHALATLHTAFDLALQYAVEIGAITQVECVRREEECHTALLEIVEEQSRLVEEQDPGDIYMATLTTLLRAGKASIAQKPPPDKVAAAGYGDPNGERVGWHNHEYIYLLPSAYNAVCSYLQKEGGMFPSDEATLRKELARRGYIEQQGRHLTTAQRDEGALVRVMRMPTTQLLNFARRMGVEAEDIRYTVRDWMHE